jgi:hypothetical protein
VRHWQQTITQKAEAMQYHTALSLGFWKLAIETAVHIYNRHPLCRHYWKSLITVWDSTISDILYFRVFGCKAYVYTHKDARVNKLQTKAKVMIFVGYEIGTKGYQFWDSSAQSLIVACNVTFNENSFPRQESRTRELESVEVNPPV